MKGERGMSLIEALVAVAIVGIVIAGVAPAFFVQMDTNTRNEQRTEAAAAAAEVLEALRLEDPSAMPTTGSRTPKEIRHGNRVYRVTETFCANPDFCGADSRHVVIDVTLDGDLLYHAETVYSQLR